METIFKPIENFFMAIGMGIGEYAPLKRFIFGFLVSGIVLYAIKPSTVFNEDGSTKKWNILNIGESGSTSFPWWMWSFLVASFCGVFI